MEAKVVMTTCFPKATALITNMKWSFRQLNNFPVGQRFEGQGSELRLQHGVFEAKTQPRFGTGSGFQEEKSWTGPSSAFPPILPFYL